LYYTQEELEGIIYNLDNNHKIYHNRRNSLPTIITKDHNSDNKLVLTVMVPKNKNNNNNNNNKSNTASKSVKEASGSREEKKESSPSVAHPTEGTTKKVVEAPQVASGTNPKVVESAVPSSSGQSEPTETKVMAPSNSDSQVEEKKPPLAALLLPHEEDIEMKNEDSFSSVTMEEIDNYWKHIPDEIPSLESTNKNQYGCSGLINSFNPNNPGNTFILSNDKMFKDLKSENELLKQQMVQQQNQINALISQLSNLTTNANSTIELNKQIIHDKENAIEQLKKRNRDDLDIQDMEIYKTQNDVEDLKKRLNIFKINTNNNVKQLESNFNYNQEVIKEAQRTLQSQDESLNKQHKLIEDLNNKVVTIYNTLQTADKGKNKSDEVSLIRLNQTKKELETFKAEMNLKFKLQDKLVSSYSKVQDNLTKIAERLNNYQDQIDNINNQIKLEGSNLTDEKINELTTSQIDLQNKYNNTLKALNNIKINNTDIDKNFKDQIKTINNNISKYNLDLRESNLQKQYQNLVLQNPKTTKFFKYEVTKNSIILSLADPKYANLVNKLILKHYQTLWKNHINLDEPTIDDLSFYINDPNNSLNISLGDSMDKDAKSFVGNSTMENFKKTFGDQLRKELKDELDEEKATSSKNSKNLKEMHERAIKEMNDKYNQLSDKLKNANNLNKEEINKFLIEFETFKNSM